MRARESSKLIQAVVVSAVMVGAVATLAACPSGGGKRRIVTIPVPTHGDRVARERFLDVQSRFERDSANAEDFEAIAQEFPRDPIAPHARTWAGIASVRDGDYDQAAAALADVADDRAAEPALRRRARLFLGFAETYRGNHGAAVAHLKAGQPAAESDDERIEWLAAMAEAISHAGNPLDSVRYYSAWHARGKPSERGYAAARLRALVAAAPPEAVRLSYDSLRGDRGGDADGDLAAGVAIVGARLAAEIAAAGDPAGAGEIRRIAAAAAARAGLRPPYGDARRAGDADPDRVGAVLPLSGRQARAGDLVMRGLALVSGTFGEDAGRLEVPAFELVVRDSASAAAAAGTAVEELAADRAIAIIGPLDGDSVDVAAQRADRLGVPLISLNPRASKRRGRSSPFVFHILHSAEERARSLARHAIAAGVTSFAILSPNSGYGRAVGGAFAAEVRERGGTIATEVSYKPNETSFGGVIRKLKRERADGVFVPDQASRLELIAPALAAENLIARPTGARKPRRGRKVLLLSTAEFVSPDYLRGSGRYSEGAVFAPGFYPDRFDRQIRAFVEQYEAAFGRLPTALDAYAFDAALIVRRAVADGATTRGELSTALAAGNVEGVTGKIAFDAARRRGDDGLLYQVQRDDGEQFRIRALRD